MSDITIKEENMDKFYKDSNLYNGKGEDGINWITVNGTHIPIKEGQSKEQTIKKYFASKHKQTKQSLEEQVNNVLNGTFKGSHITIYDSTPNLLKNLGFPDKPILMTAKHAYLVIKDKGVYKSPNDNYHDLGKETFLLALKLIKNPTMVLQNGKNKDEVVLILNWYDKQKNMLIMPMILNGKGNKNYIEIEANIIKSVYGKENFKNYINKNFTLNDILYAGNKKIRDLQ